MSMGMKERLDFGQYVRERRRKISLSQADLASLLSVSTMTINRYENGLYLPKPDLYQCLEHALEMGSEGNEKLRSLYGRARAATRSPGKHVGEESRDRSRSFEGRTNMEDALVDVLYKRIKQGDVLSNQDALKIINILQKNE